MKKLKHWSKLYQEIVLEGQMSFEEWLKAKEVNNNELLLKQGELIC